MKTAAKIFIIIGMIIGFWMILPIIFGALSLGKINTATQKSELVGLGICTLIFCSVLGGIFMLCIPEEQLNQGGAVAPAPAQATAAGSSTNAKPEAKKSTGEVADSLKKLKELKDAGTITDEEYDKMKKDLLSKM